MAEQKASIIEFIKIASHTGKRYRCTATAHELNQVSHPELLRDRLHRGMFVQVADGVVQFQLWRMELRPFCEPEIEYLTPVKETGHDD